METVLDNIISNDLLSDVFKDVNKKIVIDSIHLAGQSFGGGTVL
jgi:hypothetical protein